MQEENKDNKQISYNSFADWVLDLSFDTFFWLATALGLGLWTVTITVLLVYLHFVSPR
jgi:hypothetical protein